MRDESMSRIQVVLFFELIRQGCPILKSLQPPRLVWFGSFHARRQVRRLTAMLPQAAITQLRAQRPIYTFTWFPVWKSGPAPGCPLLAPVLPFGCCS